MFSERTTTIIIIMIKYEKVRQESRRHTHAHRNPLHSKQDFFIKSEWVGWEGRRKKRTNNNKFFAGVVTVYCNKHLKNSAPHRAISLVNC